MQGIQLPCRWTLGLTALKPKKGIVLSIKKSKQPRPR